MCEAHKTDFPCSKIKYKVQFPFPYFQTRSSKAAVHLLLSVSPLDFGSLAEHVPNLSYVSDFKTVELRKLGLTTFRITMQDEHAYLILFP